MLHILIIDGLSFLFRAYHGVRQSLTKSDGTPVNALFGFAQMLVKVVDDLKPDVCLVALDSIGPTFRKDIYPAYKANRPPPDPEMLIQLRMFQPMVEAFGIPAIRVEGVEADDIIATVVEHYKNGDNRITIVSSDKDLMQLIGPTVRMYDTMKDKWFAAPEVVEKFGVGPDKVIEVQSLIGDSSDNIPGVKGIGPKGASELINRFGDLESLYQNIAQVERDKLRESLIVHKTEAFMSRELVSLKKDVELPVGWNELTFAPKLEVAAEYLEDELEFKGLAGRLRARSQKSDIKNSSAANSPGLTTDNRQRTTDWYAYETIQTLDRWQIWMADIRAAGEVVIDTETTSLDPYAAELVGMSLCVNGRSCYVPLAHKSTASGDGLFEESGPAIQQISKADALRDMRIILADPAIRKIGHNLKYDWLILARAIGVIPADTGAELQNLITNFDDTMLMSGCLDGGRWGHGLDTLAQKHLGHAMISFEDVCGRGKAQVTFDKVPLDAATRYAGEDVDATARLYRIFKDRMAEFGEIASPRYIYEKVERELLPIIVLMEARGVLANRDELRGLSDDFARRMAALEADIHALAGHPFNVQSPNQLAVVLFDELKVGTDKQQKSRSTAVSVLEELDNAGVPIAEKMMAYRTLAKLRSTYTEALLEQISPVTGRVHTSYQQIGASTGRFSSSEPNLQNIPIRTEEGRKVRHAFIPRAGWVMVSADYSQIELRLLAHMSGSKALRQAFNDGLDIHAYTAGLVRGIPIAEVTKEQRRAAKFINFGLVYGMGAASLAKQIGCSKDEATEWIAAYFQRYDGVKDYMEANKQAARDKGYVETLLGRRVWLPDIKSPNGMMRSNAERAAINAPLQGSNADIIKLAMPVVEAATQAVGHTQLLMQVHDELVLEAHPDVVPHLKQTLPTLMGGVVQLSVPLAVEVGTGPNWDEAH